MRIDFAIFPVAWQVLTLGSIDLLISHVPSCGLAPANEQAGFCQETFVVNPLLRELDKPLCQFSARYILANGQPA